MIDYVRALKRGVRLGGDEVAIVFSDHACERWGERGGRELDPERARVELSSMLSAMRISTTPPDWFDPSRQPALAYGVLGDAVLPLHEDDGVLVATTLLYPGGTSEQGIEKRREIKQRQRGRRAGKRSKMHGRQGMVGPRRRQWALDDPA